MAAPVLLYRPKCSKVCLCHRAYLMRLSLSLSEGWSSSHCEYLAMDHSALCGGQAYWDGALYTLQKCHVTHNDGRFSLNCVCVCVYRPGEVTSAQVGLWWKGSVVRCCRESVHRQLDCWLSAHWSGTAAASNTKQTALFTFHVKHLLLIVFIQKKDELTGKALW